MQNTKMGLTLENKLSQKLMITPQMKQSLNLLQMPVVELLHEVNSILEDNPVIEEMESKQEEEYSEKDEFLEDLKKVEWDDYFQNDEWYYLPRYDEEVNFEKFVSSNENLYEHLLFQLTISDVSEEVKRAGEYIIGNITENGYFTLDPAAVADETNIDVDVVNEALKVVREFDPTGIAQANLKDCILKQLHSFGVNPNDIDVISEILDNFEKEIIMGDFKQVAESLAIDMEGLEKLFGYIKMTDPKPGLKFSSAARYVVPDVYIVERDGFFDVILNEEGFSPMKLNSYYVKLLKDSSLDTNTREYVEEKVKNALWLLKSLNQRKKAIQRVVEEIVKIQHDFLKKGKEFLKPLKLKDIAEATGLHESTVSRVTSGKYAMCAHGVLELRSFFIKGIESENGEVSTMSIKVQIRELIENEPKEKPYSDQKIVEILTKKGIKIARRTVAKYRESMNIPARSERKRNRR